MRGKGGEGEASEERAGGGSSKKAEIIYFEIMKILSKAKNRTFFHLHLVCFETSVPMKIKNLPLV